MSNEKANVRAQNHSNGSCALHSGLDWKTTNIFTINIAWSNTLCANRFPYTRQYIVRIYTNTRASARPRAHTRLYCVSLVDLFGAILSTQNRNHKCFLFPIRLLNNKWDDAFKSARIDKYLFPFAIGFVETLFRLRRFSRSPGLSLYHSLWLRYFSVCIHLKMGFCSFCPFKSHLKLDIHWNCSRVN